MDYDGFCDSVTDIVTDLEDQWREYKSDMVFHSISLPMIAITPAELKELTYYMPSVLDDIKVKLGLDPTRPMKSPNLII